MFAVINQDVVFRPSAIEKDLSDLPRAATRVDATVRAMAGEKLYRRWSKNARSSLFVRAMVAARHNPVLKILRDKLIAVARKPVTILNAILRD